MALKPLERLLGYTFDKPSLLIEAMSHPSSTSGTTSFERLEFLGDSILDHLVVRCLHAVSPQLSQFQMTLLRIALVNADYLAFLCMSWSITQESTTLVEDETTGQLSEKTESTPLPLWKFMRHASPQLAVVQGATATRHASLYPEIVEAIDRETQYPWALLARLQAQKYYSDIVESIIGAVWMFVSLPYCIPIHSNSTTLVVIRFKLQELELKA